MRYIEIIAKIATDDAERAADVLRDVTVGGVWIDTPFTQRDLESDAVVSTGGSSAVHAYIPADGDNGGAVLAVRVGLDAAGIAADVEARVVAQEDWAEAWKEHFQVERYGQRIVVVPSWREYTALPNDVVLTLDPGMAFGTGQHETTRMCLEAIERTVTAGTGVLDVGCGSGILSIAAAKLGAGMVRAVDVDPVCVRVSAENIALNSVSVEVQEGSLGAAWPFPDGPTGTFDVVVANIIARAIIDMADDLVGALRPDGRLIVSGVIGEREAEVLEALKKQELHVESVRAMGEWRCIEAVRA